MAGSLQKSGNKKKIYEDLVITQEIIDNKPVAR